MLNMPLKLPALLAMSMLGACAVRPAFDPSVAAMTQEAIKGTGTTRQPLAQAPMACTIRQLMSA